MKKTALALGLVLVSILVLVLNWPASDREQDSTSGLASESQNPPISVPDSDSPVQDSAPLIASERNPSVAGIQGPSWADARDGELVFLDSEGEEVVVRTVWIYHEAKGVREVRDKTAPDLPRLRWPQECGSAAVVLALAINHAPFLVWVERGVGPVVIELPRGHALAGTVETRGAEREEALFARVISRWAAAPSDHSLAELRTHMPAESLALFDWDMVHADMMLPLDGPYLLEGLASDWSGEIEVEFNLYRYRVEWVGEEDLEYWQPLTLGQPRQDLELILHENPQIHGMVVHADGSNCEHDSVYIDFYSKQGMFGIQSSNDGFQNRFETFLPGGHLGPLGMEIKHQRARYYFDPRMPDENGDLGQFVIPDDTPWGFQVIDLAGKPIPGVEFAIHRTQRKGVTDALGHGELLLAPEHAQMSLVADDFLSQIAEIPADRSQPAVFVMEPDRGYRILLSADAAFQAASATADATAEYPWLKGLHLSMECPSGFFPGGISYPLSSLLLPKANGRTGMPILYRTQYYQLSDPIIMVHGLEHRGPASVKVMLQGLVIYDAPLPPMPDAGLVDVEVVLSQPRGNPVSVRVLDELRHPRHSVDVELRGQEVELSLYTNADGLVEFPNLPLSEVEISVRVEGYLASGWVRLDLPQDGPYELVLEQGHELDLAVHLANGSLDHGFWVYAQDPATDAFLHISRAEPGHYLFHQTPSPRAEVQVDVGGWRIPFVIDTSGSSARIDLPPLHEVTLHIDATKLDRELSYALRLTQRDQVHHVKLLGAEGGFQKGPCLLPLGSYRAELTHAASRSAFTPVDGFEALPVEVTGNGPVELDFR